MPSKRVAKAPLAAKAKKDSKPSNPLFEKRNRTFGVGGAIIKSQKRDLHRFVKWPKYVRLQRQRRVLGMRLKVPPALNQFTKTFDRQQASVLFNLLMKYRPEDKVAKKERLLAEAEAAEAGNTTDKKKPVVVKYGLKHITSIIEAGKAQFVVIAHDVDPIELVVWLPALCKKMDVPYCIVKGKARLGTIVNQKNAAALCLTETKPEDQREFAKIVESARSMFNDAGRIKWGGGIMGIKSQVKFNAAQKIINAEQAKRAAV